MKQTVCKVLKIFQHGKYLVSYVLKRWNHRKLSLIGKITVVKTFALLKLIYP